MRYVLAMAAMLALSGCGADNAMTINGVQAYGNARTMPDPTDPTMLTLSLLNTVDVGYNFDNAADRAALVQRMFADQCGAPSIVEQRVTQTGPGAIRVPRLYTIRIRCPNGASRKVE